MRRVAVLIGTVVIAGLAFAASASAHPLGNFTTNRYLEVVASGDRLYALTVVDLAEIPTYQARDDVTRLGDKRYAAGLAQAVRRGLRVRVGGRDRPIVLLRTRLVFAEGVAGLRTTRLEAVFDAGSLKNVSAATLEIASRSFASRIGWKEIVLRAERGANLDGATVPARSVTDRLRRYPSDLKHSPLDQESASALVTGNDDVAGVAPALGSARIDSAPTRVEAASEGGFAALVERRDLSLGVVVVALLLALFWGAAHALTPGHGKAIVAGYLVGTRGRPLDAVLLGAIVTVTHTAGVFALGLVTLALSTVIVPEQLYPWLTLVSGLLVVGVGGAVLAGRIRTGGWHAQHRHDDHDHAGRHHDHDHRPDSGDRHAVDHHHERPPAYERRGLIGVGVAAGVLPCPSALVVLLGAIALHRVGFGLALIVAFSLGLAFTITLIGLVAVLTKRLFGRLSSDGPIVRALPAVSALAILAVGVVLTARAIPAVV